MRLLRRFIRDHDRGTHELEYNVWHVVVDLDRRVIHLTHDFDPLEGSMPLDDFLRDLDQVCPE